MVPDVDDCSTSPCENGATCVDEHGGYTCQCTDQWLGVNCTGILYSINSWIYLELNRLHRYLRNAKNPVLYSTFLHIVFLEIGCFRDIWVLEGLVVHFFITKDIFKKQKNAYCVREALGCSQNKALPQKHHEWNNSYHSSYQLLYCKHN